MAAPTNLKGRVPAQRPLQLSPNHGKALHPGLPSNPLGLREHIVAERGVEPGRIPGDTKGGALAWPCDCPTRDASCEIPGTCAERTQVAYLALRLPVCGPVTL